MIILAAFLILTLGLTISGVLYYVREAEDRARREKLINAYLEYASRPHRTDEEIKAAARMINPNH